MLRILRIVSPWERRPPVKRICRYCALLLALFLLGGCSGLSAEDLYRVPEGTEDYYNLQTALSRIMTDGYSYLTPASGSRREAIQRVDLDGDGVDEALVFLHSGDGGVQVYIFGKTGGEYLPAAVLDGAGSSVASVDYEDVAGDSGPEILLTCQVSGAVPQALQVYEYDGREARSLLNTGCSEYTLADLDGDGRQEIFCITETESAANACYYDGTEKGISGGGSLRLSFPCDGLRRLRMAGLSDGQQAMLVTGSPEDGTLITDVLVAAEDGLRRVTPRQAVLTLRSEADVYPADMDGDGAAEFPCREPYSGGGEESVPFIRWYGLSSGGRVSSRLLTCYNAGAGWYFSLPEQWDGTVSAGDVSTEEASGVSFYRLPEGKTGSASPERLLTVYCLRGGGRQSYVEAHGLTSLYSDGDVTYAVDLNDNAQVWEGTITLAQVSEMFHMIPAGSAKK